MQKIAVWGTGMYAQKFYFMCDDYDIECFYDRNPDMQNRKFMGKPVKNWDVEKYDGFIVIASSWWKDIAQILCDSGRRPFKDFVPANYLLDNMVMYHDVTTLMHMNDGSCDFPVTIGRDGRKLAVVYGNCQTSRLECALTLNSQFIKDYLIVRTPKVCEFSGSKEQKAGIEQFVNDRIFFEKIGTFVYQTVSENNKFSPVLATDRLKKLLSPECTCINIINMYFNGYFPQVTKGIPCNALQFRWFVFDDKYVDALLDKGLDADDIVRTVMSEDFIDGEEIISNSRASIDELRRREEAADVKIAEYIADHYRTKQLFHSASHPVDELILEYCDRILELMGYVREEYDLTVYLTEGDTMKGEDIPLYPAVIKALGLTEYEKYCYPDRYMPGG